MCGIPLLPFATGDTMADGVLADLFRALVGAAYVERGREAVHHILTVQLARLVPDQQ
jgi:hypothetical protein